MTEHFEFTIEERELTLNLYSELKEKIALSLEEDDESHLRSHLLHAIEQNLVRRDVFGLNPIVSSLQTALLVVDEIGLKRDAVIAVLLNPIV
jgi:GTP pyrophosphokinase